MKLTDRFQWESRCYVMGILNVTPDSFSGDGLLSAGENVESALEQAHLYLKHGADVLDVGGGKHPARRGPGF